MLNNEVVVKHVMNLAQIDHTELVAEHGSDVHLREGAGGHRNVVLARDFR